MFLLGLRISHPSSSAGDSNSVEYGWKICPCGLVVEAHGHQSHRLHNLQAIFQAPTEQCSIACWHDDARAEEGRSACDQSLEVIIGSTHCVPKKSYCGRVCRNSPVVLRYNCRALF